MGLGEEKPSNRGVGQIQAMQRLPHRLKARPAFCWPLAPSIFVMSCGSNRRADRFAVAVAGAGPTRSHDGDWTHARRVFSRRSKCSIRYCPHVSGGQRRALDWRAACTPSPAFQAPPGVQTEGFSHYHKLRRNSIGFPNVRPRLVWATTGAARRRSVRVFSQFPGVPP